jgi:WD40 repeat protein
MGADQAAEQAASSRSSPLGLCELFAREEELWELKAAVTCICFAREGFSGLSYNLLAVGAMDGSIVIHTCPKTKMEVAMLRDDEGVHDASTTQEEDLDKDAAGELDGSQTHMKTLLHSRLGGHEKAVTSMAFLERVNADARTVRLVTTSADGSLVVWCVDSSEKLVTLSVGAPLCAAVSLPGKEFLWANTSNSIIQVGLQDGNLRSTLEYGSTLEVESELSTLSFDGTSCFLLAGSADGGLHAFEASSDGSKPLRFLFAERLAGSASRVTSIVNAPKVAGSSDSPTPQRRLVVAFDLQVALVSCIYGVSDKGLPEGILEGFKVLRLLQLAESAPACNWWRPQVSCSSSGPAGHLFVGSNSGDVRVFSLKDGTEQSLLSSKAAEPTSNPLTAVFTAPPRVGVATTVATTSPQDTLLATGDALGRVALWRCRVDDSDRCVGIGETSQSEELHQAAKLRRRRSVM